MKHDPDIDPVNTPVSASWAVSVTEDLKRSNRIAWMVASVVAIIAILEGIALVFLVPLKSVEPYTLLVDRQTGNIEALAPLDTQIVAPDAALTRSFLVQYVIARESFTQGTLQDDYRKVSLWSERNVAERYQRLMDASNSRSPLSYLQRGSSVRTEVKSVSELAKDRSMIRFATTVIDGRGRRQEPQNWVAIINYSFSAASMSESDRYLNPLGFQVTSYRRDVETIPEDDGPNGVRELPAIGAAQ